MNKIYIKPSGAKICISAKKTKNRYPEEVLISGYPGGLLAPDYNLQLIDME